MRIARIATRSTLAVALLAGATFAGAKTVKHSSKATSGHYVGVAAARKAALRAVPGRALSAGLENEDGKMQYSVMIQGKSSMHEVMVDARTGKVASQEKVTAGEEAREAAAEAKSAKAVAKHRSIKK